MSCFSTQFEEMQNTFFFLCCWAESCVQGRFKKKKSIPVLTSPRLFHSGKGLPKKMSHQEHNQTNTEMIPKTALRAKWDIVLFIQIHFATESPLCVTCKRVLRCWSGHKWKESALEHLNDCWMVSCILYMSFLDQINMLPSVCIVINK